MTSKRNSVTEQQTAAACLAGLLTAIRLLQEPSENEDPDDNKSHAESCIAFAMRRPDCVDLAEEVKNGEFKTVKVLADEICRRKDNVNWPVMSFLRKKS